MKQGRASSSGMGATKPTTTSRVYDPGTVADIGVKQYRDVAMHAARGASSPSPRGVTIHKSGSQGRR